MPTTKRELQQRIRFALSKLSANNEHHRFEDLARHFARLRVASNTLPATGPVAAGGDQGRDFETFLSYIRSSPIANSTFVALVSEKRIVFGCSLQKKIEPKIKKDVKTILASGASIDAIYYFCEADLAVGRRHFLQAWASDKHHVYLEIIDGQGFSEQLTDPDLWWIAQEYLSISADAFPNSFADGDRYTALRKKWLEQAQDPFNYADFVEIDGGLRRAMYDDGCRADIPAWLTKIKSLLRPGCGEGMRRKVQYEIAVVTLRGLNNLSAESDLVEEFFEGLNDRLSPSELEDATVLLTYCATAAQQGHFNVDLAKLAAWASEVTSLVDTAIDHAPGKNTLCELLFIRAQACFIPIPGNSTHTERLNRMFDCLSRLLDLAAEAPLFPLEYFADYLTKLTPLVADEPRFLEITERVDQLLEVRSSGFVAAQKCYDRAKALYEAGSFIKCLRQLQRAKVKWLAAETLTKAIAAMLLIVRCYENLKLFYAAKYYAAGVIEILLSRETPGLKGFLSRAGFTLCRACYGAGATVSYLDTLHLALLLQQHYMPDPFDFAQHEYLREQIAQAAILRSVTRRLAPEVVPLLDEVAGEWSLADNLWSDVCVVSKEGAEPWHSMPIEEIWRRVQTEIGGTLYADLGSRRTICWPALGITWTVSFDNTYDVGLLGEEFAATLQILQADLAEVDLCLLPTRADIELKLTDGEQATFEEIPDNDLTRGLMSIPRRWLSTGKREEEPDLLSRVGALLSLCSVLPFDRLTAILEEAFKAGLSNKAFNVRPARELFSRIQSRDTFDKFSRAGINGPTPPAWFEIAPAPDLTWRDDLGPGYSREKAEEFIQNRYENAIRPIRLTLPRLNSDPRVRSLLKKMHEEGLRDWQILNIIASIVTNFRVSQETGSSDELSAKFEKWMFRDEEPGDPLVPISLFTDKQLELVKNFAFMANLQPWGLVPNVQTPDFAAIRRFLDVRYRNSVDDVPHKRCFSFWD